jgi:hypothetical protein
MKLVTMVLLVVGLIGGAGWAQQLPPGRLSNDPISGAETATQQIGGAGWWRYMDIGAMRCNSGTDAIVGVSTIKGTLIDYIRIACAPVARYRNGWFWDNAQVYWPDGRGHPHTDGVRQRYTVCAQNQVIAGFRAVYRDGNSYLQDLRFLCAGIQGIGPDPFNGFGGNNVPRPPVIQTNDRFTDAGWLRAKGSIKSYSGLQYSVPAADSDDLNLAGQAQYIAVSRCTGAGATALSVAVGRWFALMQPIGTNVVQAFQMFCRLGAEDDRIAEPRAPGR